MYLFIYSFFLIKEDMIFKINLVYVGVLLLRIIEKLTFRLNEIKWFCLLTFGTGHTLFYRYLYDRG